MARFTKQEIRNALAPMVRGKGIAYFNDVCVTFDPRGYFNVFKGTCHNKHSTTKSLTEAVKHVELTLR